MFVSYGFILRVRQLRRCLGLERTLPSVRAITHVGTDCDSLPALAKRSFFAGGFTLAIFLYPSYCCLSLP